MPVIFINGVPIANAFRDGIDSYFPPQQHFRDFVDAQDVEFEEVESTNPNSKEHDDQLIENSDS